MNLTIVIIEDDLKIRALMVEWLRSEKGLRVVGAFGDAESAVVGVPPLAPAVALVDINLPGASGIECVRQLKPLLPKTQFVMLTVYEDVNAIFQALAAGATGYLLKETRRGELVAAIHEVRQGGSPMSSAIARKVVQSFTAPAVQATATAHPELQLTDREHAILNLLVGGYQYKEIGDQLGISMGSVNTFVRKIYEKLHVNSRAEAMLKYRPGVDRRPAGGPP